MDFYNDLCQTCQSGGFKKCKTDFDKIQLDIKGNVVSCDCYKEKPKKHLKITYEYEDRIAVVEQDVYEDALPDVKWKLAVKAYGEFNNVILTDVELNKLKERYPNEYIDTIESLSRYIENEPKKTKRYNSHYAVICNWIIRELKERKIRSKEVLDREKRRENKDKLKITPSYDLENIKKSAISNTEI